MPVETAVYCARHPKVETGITCARCGTPICPKCMVVTPVGMKCPDCGSSKSALTQVRPERFLLAALVSLIAGMVAAVIGEIGFFVIFVSIPYGYFAGAMILKASGMKRGLTVELTAGVGIAAGALAFKLLPSILFAGPLMRSGYSAISFGASALLDIFFLAAVVITTVCAVSRIRYF